MDLEVEYDNRARVPDHPAAIEAWKADADAYRRNAASHAELDLPYGARERNRFDLFRAPQPMDSCLCVFIHGGYFRAFDKSMFSHMASGLNANGIDVAVPSYSLCPAVTVPDIIAELRQALLHLWTAYKRPLVAVGHSAGGHLAACMAATSWPAYGAPDDLVRAGFGISGLYDLRPLLATTVNETARLSEAEAAAASPLLWPVPRAARFDAWVGEKESAEYYRQSASLAAAWKGLGRTAGYHVVPGADHFSIVDALTDPKSPMTRHALTLCGR